MIEFEIPGAPPLLLNARLHHMDVNRQRKKWKGWVWAATTGKRPPQPWERALVVYTRYCGFREPDEDNLASGFKWIQDGLVEAGIIADDRRSNVESYYLWEPASPKLKRVRVEVMPVFEKRRTPPLR